MNKLRNKMVACFMALVMAMGFATVAQTTTTVQAKKSYNAFLYYTNSDWSCKNQSDWIANTSVKNKKGKKRYTVTLKRSDCIGESIANKAKEGPVSDHEEISVYIQDIIKDHAEKNLKVSNIVVKCDGKKVKIKQSKVKKYVQKSEDGSKSYVLMLYYVYGSQSAKAKAFKWSDKISVSFDLNIKK